MGQLIVDLLQSIALIALTRAIGRILKIIEIRS